jgi:hypothetical protein
MAKKTRKHSRKQRRVTRRRIPRRHKRGGATFPLIPSDSAFPHSTVGESSDNVMGYVAKK